jgi:hypothetical protein
MGRPVRFSASADSVAAAVASGQLKTEGAQMDLGEVAPDQLASAAVQSSASALQAGMEEYLPGSFPAVADLPPQWG